MACTGPCFIEYTLMIGKILVFIWNNPLKDIVKDLADESKMAHPSKSPYKNKDVQGIRQAGRPVSPFLTL